MKNEKQNEPGLADIMSMFQQAIKEKNYPMLVFIGGLFLIIGIVLIGLIFW